MSAVTSAIKSFSFMHFVAAVAFVMSAYHYTVGYLGEPIAEIHRPAHLLFALLILFWSSERLGSPSQQRRQFIIDLALSGLLLAACSYLWINSVAISERMIRVSPVSDWQMIWGLVLLAVILEAARRSVGWVLVWVGLFFLVYTLVGPYLPDPFWHNGYDLEILVEHMYLDKEGIWTTPLAVTASFVFLFVLFGSLLLSSGAGDFFTDLAKALTGRQTGGPAKTAVVASALMGTLTGSSAANVVTTGSFTIPAMRKAGYRGHFAAGVEACASCGGQLTPPIMGSAAFIMMEFIGVSYVEVMRVAIIPAFIYFLACFAMVDLEARRTGLKPMPSADLPRVRDVLQRRGYLLLAVFALLYYLFEGYTPSTAAFWSITYLACLVVMFDEVSRRWWNYLIVFPIGCVLSGLYFGTIINAVSGGLVIAAAVQLAIDHRIRVHIVKVLWEAMVEAPKLIAPVTVACAVGGMIVGSITLTGLGERMSVIVLQLGGGYLLLTLFFTMLMAVFLGMGMPTSGAYIVLATLLVPALLEMLVPSYSVMFNIEGREAEMIALMSSHMFIIYCASKSSLTPPVAIASYAAAAVANTDPWRTSLTAFRIGLPIFIIPYMFVFGPHLLWYGDPLSIVWATITASLGVWIMSVGCIGWLLVPVGWIVRGVALGASLALMFAGWKSDAVGIGLVVLLVIYCYFRRRQMLARGEPVIAQGGEMLDEEAAAPQKSPGE